MSKPELCEWCEKTLLDGYYSISIGERKSGYFCSRQCRSVALDNLYFGTPHPKFSLVTPLIVLLGIGWTIFVIVAAFSSIKSSGLAVLIMAPVVWFFGLFVLSIFSSIVDAIAPK